jgi:outer membrane receptor protein involved in Fe transport
LSRLPLNSSLALIGGVRSESTEIGIVNAPEADALWFPPGADGPIDLEPGDADVTFENRELLPSIALEVLPLDRITLRLSYNETVARQTFKELTPIIQQEFLGGPIFIGNPELRISKVRNYDARLDYTPYDDGLLSVSWFRKDIDDAIEYVQRIVDFSFTSAVNYPEGQLTGWELEARQGLGHLWQPHESLAIGANATFIESEVTLPADEAAAFDQLNIRAPMSTRDMTGAPDHLYNLFLTFDLPSTGTRAGLFYTIQGDTLIAGAGQANGNFVPSVYATEYDTLNFSVAQRLGEHTELQFQAKNLTNPRIDTVYRSIYIGDDVRQTSTRNGIDVSISISAEFRF